MILTVRHNGLLWVGTCLWPALSHGSSGSSIGKKALAGAQQVLPVMAATTASPTDTTASTEASISKSPVPANASVKATGIAKPSEHETPIQALPQAEEHYEVPIESHSQTQSTEQQNEQLPYEVPTEKAKRWKKMRILPNREHCPCMITFQVP